MANDPDLDEESKSLCQYFVVDYCWCVASKTRSFLILILHSYLALVQEYDELPLDRFLCW